MQAAQLERMADLLLSVPFTPGPKPKTPLFLPRRDAPLRPLELCDADRWLMADYLRSLIKPRVLKALAAARTPVEKRGPKSDSARLWRAALDFEISKRPKGVAAAWKLSLSRLYEIHAEFSERCKRPDGHPGAPEGSWRSWAAYELYNFRHTHQALPPCDRRAAFIDELRKLR